LVTPSLEIIRLAIPQKLFIQKKQKPRKLEGHPISINKATGEQFETFLWQSRKCIKKVIIIYIKVFFLP